MDNASLQSIVAAADPDGRYSNSELTTLLARGPGFSINRATLRGQLGLHTTATATTPNKQIIAALAPMDLSGNSVLSAQEKASLAGRWFGVGVSYIDSKATATT